ncbi:dipeptidyl peptidase IV N-terminal region-domain-containing protein [Auriculariales sp. MPI-PUGE-AT-0066]|nr:dipeptidyl peptidase IV N-terminal region-domain-containing protein [Auriculariales sp. MPI-PUGE-AT-0066]
MPHTPGHYSRLSQADIDAPGVDVPAHGAPVTANSNARPQVYFGEGTFDAPSSDDEDSEEKPLRHGPRESTSMRVLHTLGFQDNPGTADDLDLPLAEGLVVGQRRNIPLRVLLFALLGLCVLAATIGFIAASSYNGTTFRSHGPGRIDMNHIFNGTFRSDTTVIHWVPEAGDGVFSVTNGFDLNLVDLSTNTTTTLLKLSDLKDEHGNILRIHTWQLSADMKYVLIATDWVKQWRYSGWANYYIYTLADGTTRAIMSPTSPPTISVARWAPVGNSLAYVSNNDLYVLPEPAATTPIRVTATGNHSFFNGIADWVYEEEVLGGPKAFWWSPDDARIAYLVTNDDGIRDFEYSIFNTAGNSENVQPYSEIRRIPYPKPGTPNPLVSLEVFDLAAWRAQHSEGPSAEVIDQSFVKEMTWTDRRPKEESIIQEVTWVGNAELMVKEINRGADDGVVIYMDLRNSANGSSHIVRRLGKEGEQGDDGWIENGQRMYWLRSRTDHAAYLDVLPNPDGYLHIALFDPADSGKPQWLTSGNWEISDGIEAVDEERGLVYFLAAHPSPQEQHVYSAVLPAPGAQAVVPPAEPNALSDASVPSYYSASFSPKAGFYVLSYQGPLVPHQNIYKVANSSYEYKLNDNQRLNETLSTFQLPTVVHGTIESDGYELSTIEIRPPGMDDTGHTKYPVLFRVYGGPTYNLATYQFSIDWQHYLASAPNLKYVTVIVDGRGTMYRGRKVRNPVRGNIGYYEAIDQANAARVWAGKRYVDSRRIGIWGWSYGGYLTLKVVEAAFGLHNLAIAVAPVVDWRFYDSIYTERYLNTLTLNQQGYDNSAVRNVTNFGKTHFALAHGSGDDNVHFANSAHLIDLFTQEHVHNYQFRMFTDSDHGIYTRGANRELYEWMTDFLYEKWGKGGVRRGW